MTVDVLTTNVLRGFPRGLDPSTINTNQVRKLVAALRDHVNSQGIVPAYNARADESSCARDITDSADIAAENDEMKESVLSSSIRDSPQVYKSISVSLANVAEVSHSSPLKHIIILFLVWLQSR